MNERFKGCRHGGREIEMTRSRIILTLAVVTVMAGLGWILSGSPGGEGGQGRGERGQKPVLVTLTTADLRPFVDVIKAVGSARANESIELTAKVADTVERLNFSDGQKVTAGHLVAEMNLREQTADLKAAEANLQEQERSLLRGEQLRDRGFVSSASIDALRAARDSAAARVAVTRSRIADRSIRAPFAGVLGLRRVSAGALVKPGEVITTLDDISSIKVDFPVAETQLTDIALGQKVLASAAAFSGESFSGEIESIDTRIDPASRAVTVRAVFPNEQTRLRPGMLMTVGIETRSRTSLAVAEQTLVPIEARQYVYVVDAENKAERREVTTGSRIPGYVEILSGLKKGDRVVLEGTLKMRPGATITLGEAEERKEAGPARPGGDRRP